MASPSPYPSPSANAVAGSLGSALALFLFYPLERARIEIQASRAAAANNNNNNNKQCSSSSSPESSFDLVDAPSNDTTERVTTALQDQNNSISQVGVWSCLVDLHNRGELYSGVKPVVTTLGISNYVFFYALSLIKRLLASRDDGGGGKSKSLLASSLAGIINVLITNPLWVANLRIARGQNTTTHSTDKYDVEPSLLHMMQTIAREEGVDHLWSGTWASILLVSNPVIQFFTYEQLRSLLLRRKMTSYRGHRQISKATVLSPVEAFACGAVSKTIATVVTYPIQLAQTVLRMQEKQSQIEQNANDNGRNSPPSRAVFDRGTLHCLHRLFQEGGVANCYSGMDAKLLQTVFTASFMFLTYEQILVLVSKLA